jgi:hypothetical protein
MFTLYLYLYEVEKGPRPTARIGEDGVVRRIVNVSSTFREPSETAWTQHATLVCCLVAGSGVGNEEFAKSVSKNTPNSQQPPTPSVLHTARRADAPHFHWMIMII